MDSIAFISCFTIQACNTEVLQMTSDKLRLPPEIFFRNQIIV